MYRFIYTLILGVIGAILVHILALLGLPHFKHAAPFTSLASKPLYRFESFEKDAPLFNSFDPAFYMRICRFDLSDGPLRLQAFDPVGFWSFSIYAPSGQNIYSLNKKILQKKLDVTIADPIEAAQLKARHKDEAFIISQNIQEGFLLLRAYANTRSQKLLAENFLSHASCRPLEE